MTLPKSAQSDLVAFYGNPDANGDGQADAKWEAENLITIRPPYSMVWSWSQQPVRTIRLHKKCADRFANALADVGNVYSPEQLNLYQLDQCGGGYNFRLMRGINRLSVHAYGAALDLAPEKNWLGRKWDGELGMMPQQVVEIFYSHGLRWGGLWPRPDAMHFEATCA